MASQNNFSKSKMNQGLKKVTKVIRNHVLLPLLGGVAWSNAETVKIARFSSHRQDYQDCKFRVLLEILFSKLTAVLSFLSPDNGFLNEF